MVAVGPGIPTRVISLLQHKLLPAEGSALECQPPARGSKPGSLLLLLREGPCLVRKDPHAVDL